MIGTDEQLPSTPIEPRADAAHPSASPESASQAASRWLSEHGGILWAFCKARTRSDDAAEELVQETLLAAMQAHADFAGRASERTWLLGIASHKIADHFRRAAKRRTTSTPLESSADTDGPDAASKRDFDARGMWASLPATFASPDEQSEKITNLRLLHGCIASLPEGQGEAVWLREVAGLPTDEVCKAMRITPTNLWTRLHRARSALRICMETKLGMRTHDEDAEVSR
jgi:RNA polymerase sigma-70 factor, ECF subfamily